MKQFSKKENQGLFAKFIFAFLFAFLTVQAQAQTEIATAKSYLSTNAVKQKLSVNDIAEMSVSSAYLSPTTGWYHIYFNQSYQSVEVYNGLLGVTLNNGQVGYVANSFVPNLASRVPAGLIYTKITPIKALQKAATSVNLTASNAVSEISKSFLPNGTTINQVSFLDPSISNEKVDVKLYWLPYESIEGEKAKSKVVLTWNVRITTKDGKNIWNMHVDAVSGNILQTYDDVIHCNFGTPEHNKAPHVCTDNLPNLPNSKALLGNTYNVFDYPLEAPTFGARTVVSSPYTRFIPARTGLLATNGWHDDGTTSFTNTKGNNVDAKDDIANDNEGTVGSSPSSATLDFNFPYTQSTGTAAANLNAAITNMFYWNNVMHDVLWKFGFDEPGGNFQKNNLTNGGAGNDFVFADAQDGSGTNNANFATPPDGSNPRMQMFIFSNAGSPSYQPDSDFDNGVIAHEYGHGWSNRLTGGPAVVNCLQNAEQGGEGWSDYVALMTITDWSTLTPTIASANIPRGIGTYVLGQPTTGAGIRPFRYSYDKTNINNAVTYAGVNAANASTFPLPHGIGSIWATMLWDMTWEIILQDNFIDPNIYNVPASVTNYKGNIAALKLVNEGLRLQPCSPSFVQARDAILQADLMLFAGRYRCAISRAFTRRGLGALASTGVSTNDRIVTEDFTPISGPVLSSPNSATVCSNSPFTYTGTTATVGVFAFAWTRAVVSGISNPAGSASSATINETLINTTNSPITVQYIFTINPDACGGTPAPQAVNVVVNPSITPTVAAYTVCQNASVPSGEGLAVAASLPVTTINGTIVSGTTYVRGSGDNATTYTASRPVFFKTYTFVAPVAGSVTFATTAAVLAPGSPDDTYLTLYQTSFDPANPATNFLRGDDDSGGGSLLSSLTQTLTAGTIYIVVVSTFNTGATGTFTLQASTAVFGQTVNWYLNASGGSPLATGAVFNPVGVAGSGIPNTATLASTTFFVANAVFPDCRTDGVFTVGGSVGGSVTADATVCTGSNSGTLTLAGHTGTILRWESSIDNFVTPVVIANTSTTQPYLNLTQTTKYRAVVQNGTCAVANSSPATITVTNFTVAGAVTPDATVCSGSNGATLTLAGHTGAILRWESSTDNFVTPVTIANTTTTQPYLNLTQTTKYRAVVQNGTCTIANSSPATITVTVNVVVAGSVTADASVCSGTNSGILTLSGHLGTVVNWESSVDNFTTITTIANTTISQPYSNLTQTTKFRAVVQGTPCGSTLLPVGQGYSSAATITVNPVPIITASANQTICSGTPASLTATCDLQTVTTTLNGTSQVPANASTATGSVTGTFNPTTNQLNLTISFSGLAASASAGHIHNAAVGVNGGVIIGFSGVPASTSGTFNYSGIITTSQATALLAGNTYVNIHNSSFPGGEIRGQLSTTCVANSFVWNPGALSGQNVSVSPILTTTYTLTASNTTTTCSSTATTTVTVLAPAIPVATGASVILGGSVTLTATGCTGAGFQLNWFETVGNVPVTMPVSPIADKQYYAKCQQSAGAVVCSSTKSNDVTVTVTSVPLFTIIYVNQANVNPTQDGLTWTTAFSNLHSGLAAATPGAEVWVAKGTYKPTTTTNRTISFVVPSGIKMVGGFVGSETASTQRNFKVNLTILSGEIGDLGNLADNTYHVVRLNNADNTTVIDGFMITRGFAATTPPTPLIEPVEGVPNVGPSQINTDAGGGILAENSLVTITNCTIVSNQATFGGGIFMSSGSYGTISFCKIAGNLATFGGGIYNFACNPDINNSQVTGNKALGGGIYNNDADPTITNVTIAANNGFLGSIYNTPAPPIESNPIVRNCIIWDNSGILQANSSVINYSIVQSSYPGTINLIRDPMFVSPQPPGVAPITTGDYHVKINSPCTDTGDNTGISLTTNDLDNNLRRFSGGRVDRGAYEFQGIGGGIVISTRTGGWDDPVTWDVNRVPYPSDMVIINTNHVVTILGDSNAKNVEYRSNGKVFFMNAASKLFVGF